MAYATSANVASYLKRSLSSSETDFLDTILLPAVDEFINDEVGTQGFGTGTSTSARLYDGLGSRWLFIDPAEGITNISYVDELGEVSEVLTAQTDWVAYPLNEDSKNMVYSRTGRWYRGHGNVQVTGDFQGAVPHKITLAAIMLASSYLSSDKNLKSESIEGYSRTFSEITQDSPEIMDLLDSERRVRL